MVFKKNTKIGIVTGLRSEKKVVKKKKNLFIENGYGEKAYEAAKKVLKYKVDIIISFGLAGSMTTKLKNSQIIMPKKILNKELKSKKTSIISNSYLRKKSKKNIISNVSLLTSETILNTNLQLSEIDAVDMEACFVLKAALEHKTPFTSVKVIFDDVDNPIPNFIINSIDSKGKLKVLNLFVYVLKNPFRIKQLLKLNKLYYKSMHELKLIASELF